MDKNKLSDLAGRLQKGGKGAGIGAGLIAAAGAAMYGIYQSFYTGKNCNKLPNCLAHGWLFGRGSTLVGHPSTGQFHPATPFQSTDVLPNMIFGILLNNSGGLVY